MITKSTNTINYNGRKYNFLQKELQDAFLELGIVTFRYYPQEKLLIASDNFVKVLSAQKIYSNMPQSLADLLIADEDRALLYDMAARIDRGERKVSEVMRTKIGNISRVTVVALETSPDGKNLTMAGLVEDVAEKERSSALLEALSKDYSCVYYVDYKKNKVIPHRLEKHIEEIYGKFLATQPTFEATMEAYIKNTVAEVEKNEMLQLTSVENLRKVFKERDVYVHDYRAIHNEKNVYCRMKFVNLSKGDELTSFVMGFSDMSQERALELERIAFVDPLTGGDNYNSFKRRVKDINKPGFMISMDIHQFKLVNSICGVSYGDRVIKRIWEKVVETLGNYGVAGHVHADHFVVYSPNLKKEDVKSYVNEISEKLYKLSVEMRCPRLYPYFGISTFDPEKNVETIYSETTVAKHAIKDDTKKNYLFYSQKENDKIVKNKSMADAFPMALANGDFEVWYQPKYSPATKKITGAEALVRWRHPNVKKLVPPGEFIPLFENNGLIRTLDEYIFDKVCRFIRRRINRGEKVVPISVNLSRASLFTDGIAEQYKNICLDVGVDPKLLPIEITESAAVDHQVLNTIINTFKEQGFLLCVDDFGTGYSTLSLLSHRQFDNLKLDKSLVDDITGDDGYKLIKHTVALSKDLGMDVTAEGVEEPEQLDLLTELGCDSIQGFLFSAPVPEHEFVFKLDN